MNLLGKLFVFVSGWSNAESQPRHRGSNKVRVSCFQMLGVIVCTKFATFSDASALEGSIEKKAEEAQDLVKKKLSLHTSRIS